MGSMNFLKKRIWFAAVAMTPIVGFASTAWAQRQGKPPGDDSVTMQWTIAIGLLVVVGVSAFLNPKRSHLN